MTLISEIRSPKCCVLFWNTSVQFQRNLFLPAFILLITDICSSTGNVGSYINGGGKVKKQLTVLLSLATAFSLAACGAPAATAGDSSGSGQSASEATASAASSNDVYEIKMVMPYILTAPGEEAVQKTEDTINDYLLNTLGITDYKLDLTVLTWTDSNTIVPMDLAAQEKMDIISVGSNNIANYVSNGYLTPLDDYLDNELKEAAEIVKDFMICYKLNGHYYALPSWSGQVIDYRFVYNKEMVDAVCDMSEVDTIDEVYTVLEDLKEAYPDEHFLAYTAELPNIYNSIMDTALIGTYTATVGEDTQIVNYYTTDAFKTACEKAYELRQKGMADPEGSANTLGHDALTYSGSTKGVLMGHSLTEDSVVSMFDENNTYGAKFDAITFCRTDMVNARFSYGIPYTSKNPSAAAKFLNLIWTDEFIFNTLGFGTEGIDYVKTDTDGVIEYPEGLGQLTVPYNCIYALAGIGNQRMIWQAPGGTTKEDLAFIDEEMNNCFFPPAFGFAPVNDKVSNQVAAVSNVVTQYYDSLRYGDVDPAEFLPKFLAELDAAGINDIVAEYQTQFDAWRAENNQ